LDLPVDCTIGETCFVQNYVDHDPGPGATDFLCGPLSYDGHKGTDIGLPSLNVMQAGVDVIAAAPGIVIGIRDGMPDIAHGTAGAPELDGRDCGNGVLVDHGAGWQTQYCHMKEGSLRTHKGQTVAAGDILGQVGLSGRTEFPHLHLTVRKDGETVDPFRPDARDSCGDPASDTLWSEPVTYRAGGFIDAGFWPDLPDYESIKAGTASAATMAPDAGALVLWGYLFGGRAGDTILLEITGPEGQVLKQAEDLTRTQAQLFRAAGKRRAAPWPTGRYSGTVTLMRDGAPLDSMTRTVTVAD
jgi:hypothetical protein